MRHPHRFQAQATGVEVVAHVLGMDQFAGQVVGPLVVGTDDVAHNALRFGAQARAPVAADVVEGLDVHVVVAHDQDRVLAEVHGDVVAGFGHLRLYRNEDPVLAEDVFHVGLQDGVAEVERGFQAVARAAAGQSLAGEQGLRRKGGHGVSS